MCHARPQNKCLPCTIEETKHPQLCHPEYHKDGQHLDMAASRDVPHCSRGAKTLKFVGQPFPRGTKGYGPAGLMSKGLHPTEKEE